ncbi:RraA family protein [uncultured Draconibacterium sp.]|uniref:RraA family protein n=1 Tax=uncultured Draconibacterium sp. TaxID=1573823 RepID=UPI0025EA9D94|nr:RraA family protein [uncultured Draconibacterium sp.]
MKKLSLTLFLFILIVCNSFAQEHDYWGGVNFIETSLYSEEEDLEIIEMYKELRVADVADGMDMVGLPHTGLVDPAIHPNWKDLEDLSHIVRGVALTARYVPTQRPDRPREGQDFKEWELDFYAQYSSEKFAHIIRKGSVVVIDGVEGRDIRSIGSNNTLMWKSRGCVGIVTDAGAGDTDESAIEKIPLYLRKKGRGIRPGRNELESVNRPVVIGGVLVCPGDIVIADGDGVIVVPRKVAKQVAVYAQEILEKDKIGRRKFYDILGIPHDDTVK